MPLALSLESQTLGLKESAYFDGIQFDPVCHLAVKYSTWRGIKVLTEKAKLYFGDNFKKPSTSADEDEHG